MDDKEIFEMLCVPIPRRLLVSLLESLSKIDFIFNEVPDFSDIQEQIKALTIITETNTPFRYVLIDRFFKKFDVDRLNRLIDRIETGKFNTVLDKSHAGMIPGAAALHELTSRFLETSTIDPEDEHSKSIFGFGLAMGMLLLSSEMQTAAEEINLEDCIFLGEQKSQEKK